MLYAFAVRSLRITYTKSAGEIRIVTRTLPFIVLSSSLATLASVVVLVESVDECGREPSDVDGFHAPTSGSPRARGVVLPSTGFAGLRAVAGGALNGISHALRLFRAVE